MAAQVSLSASSSSSFLSKRVPFPCNLKLHRSLRHSLSAPPSTGPRSFKIHAKLGGEDGELKKGGGKKKFITREEEPEQYWQTAGERKGENPMKTPIPYIIIFGMSTPFVILAIAFANGWIKVPVR
ncbi:uncharacterized protein LOC116215413 [Punica granatum]|uniref:Uncharacterized protein LOC116215413 n=2 Tax=Punica granatum TaxID=22663 RepID=A0A6P8EKU7_PUNGR|nr:uncharacterized protein LOC116215413 [Punica granatum]PKI76866.1 hypothetical protein CRG98_002852 [Punica granatum]